MNWRDKIFYQRYLEDSRAEFPGDPWRYMPTCISFGLPLTGYTLGELQWALDEYKRLYDAALNWPGTSRTPEAQLADMREKIAAFEDALRLPHSIADDADATTHG